MSPKADLLAIVEQQALADYRLLPWQLDQAVRQENAGSTLTAARVRLHVDESFSIACSKFYVLKLRGGKTVQQGGSALLIELETTTQFDYLKVVVVPWESYLSLAELRFELTDCLPREKAARWGDYSYKAERVADTYAWKMEFRGEAALLTTTQMLAAIINELVLHNLPESLEE